MSETATGRVTSPDGTSIVFDRSGAKESIADRFANRRVLGLTACSPASQARSA